jgi:hypothetical protein
MASVRIALLILLVISLVTGCSQSKPPAPRPKVAAVAIRDTVPGYQQWSTEKFTVPKLEDGYDAHWYLTESKRGEKHTQFVDALSEACRKHDAVDVWLLAHGNHYIDWVRELPEAERAKIRLVYDTGGGDAYVGPQWLEFGAKAFVGHPSSNVAPLFYARFLPAWLEGKPLRDAVDEANKAMKSDLDSTVAKLVEKVAGRPGDLKRLEVGTDADVFGDISLKHLGKSGP